MYLVFYACQARVTVCDSGICCCTCVTYGVDYLPCVLILQEHSGPHSVSDFCLEKRVYPEKVPMFCVVSLKIKSAFFLPFCVF